VWWRRGSGLGGEKEGLREILESRSQKVAPHGTASARVARARDRAERASAEIVRRAAASSPCTSRAAPSFSPTTSSDHVVSPSALSALLRRPLRRSS
jgi:hypothetical protein